MTEYEQVHTIDEFNTKFNTTWNKDDYYVSNNNGTLKLLTIKDLTKSEKSFEFLNGLWLVYKEGNQLKTTNGRGVTSLLETLLEQLNESTGQKEQLTEQLQQALVSKYLKIIDEHKIFYVAAEDKYVRYSVEERKWKHYKNERGLFNYHNINDKHQIMAFKTALDIAGHKKEEVVNTFKSHTDNQLNFCTRDHWLQPIPGDVHPVFDFALRALSGENKTAQDYIEHVIAHKYLHPDNTKLPLTAINGEGGICKDEIIIGTLGVIFGNEQVLSTSCSTVLDGFNGEMLGKAIVFFNESKIEKTNYEKLKALVHSTTMPVDVKFGIKGTFDNTPLYFSGSNETMGAVKVDGSTVDRRFSIITAKRNVLEICSEEWKTPYRINDDSYSKKTLDIWFDDYQPYLIDKVEVAKWLNYILEKWKDHKPPRAFHGEEYNKLLEIQRNIVVHTMEFIFNRDNFTYICDHDAYLTYEAMVKKKSKATGSRILKDDEFFAKMDHWLSKNHPQITKQKQIKWVISKTQTTSRTVYKFDNKTRVVANTNVYVEKDERGNWCLVDIIVPDDDDDRTNNDINI